MIRRRTRAEAEERAQLVAANAALEQRIGALRLAGERLRFISVLYRRTTQIAHAQSRKLAIGICRFREQFEIDAQRIA